MTDSIHARNWPMLGIVTVMVGIGSGFGGMALGLLLRLVQHIAYGYGLHGIAGNESFHRESPPLPIYAAWLPSAFVVRWRESVGGCFTGLGALWFP